jgi:hypothetical protein
VLTDLGGSTPHVERMLDGCDALVLECNHDADMLRNGGYPPHLKRRIAGRLAISTTTPPLRCSPPWTSRLQHLIAAHLSQQNNTPAG